MKEKEEIRRPSRKQVYGLSPVKNHLIKVPQIAAHILQMAIPEFKNLTIKQIIELLPADEDGCDTFNIHNWKFGVH